MAEKFMDCVGDACPVPLIKAQNELASMKAGDVLTLNVDYLCAMKNVPGSRFCFTSAFRDPTLTGGTKMTKALLVALGVATIGFAGIHISRYGVDLSKLPENMSGLARPVGLHLVIGAFLFGIGAVLAGGCASGTLARFGEGYIQSILAFVTFILGAIIGDGLFAGPIRASPLLYSGKGVYLPAALGGYGPAILMQLLALGLLWILADRWEKKKNADFGKR